MFLSFVSGRRADLFLAVSTTRYRPLTLRRTLHSPWSSCTPGPRTSLISQETIVSGGVHGEAQDFAVLEEGRHALCSHPLSP